MFACKEHNNSCKISVAFQCLLPISPHQFQQQKTPLLELSLKKNAHIRVHREKIKEALCNLQTMKTNGSNINKWIQFNRNVKIDNRNIHVLLRDSRI